MIRFYLVCTLVAGFCLLRSGLLAADEAAPPFAMEKHYRADLTITMKEGMSIQSKTYVDGDKMRSDVTMNGMEMAIIVRKDKQKIYQVMKAQKMVMESDYDSAKFQGRTMASFEPEGKFELIGSETLDGMACTKYKVTSNQTRQVFYFWLDLVRKVPVQMGAVDGSFTVKWKNFAAGLQDSSFFEIPAGYQVVSGPGMPGGGEEGQ